MKSKIKTTIKGLLVITVFFVGLILLINSSMFDEELNPAIQQIMQSEDDSTLPEIKNNAFYALMGFEAAQGKNISQVGLQLIQRYIENRKSGSDRLLDSDYDELLGSHIADKQWRDDYDVCSNEKEFVCLQELSQYIQLHPIENKRLQLLLQRYDSIISMPDLHVLTDVSMGSPFINHGLFLQLLRISLASTYNSPNKIDFLNQLLMNRNFMKLQLKNGGTLINKMIAMDVLKSNIFYLSGFINNNTIKPDYAIVISQLTQELSSEELNLGDSFVLESKAMYRAIDDFDTGDFNNQQLFFQPNATKNSYYELGVLPFVELSDARLEEFVQKAPAVHKKINTISDEILKFNFSNFYNFSGKSMIFASLCQCGYYSARGYDLNNYIRMVRLQAQAQLNDFVGLEQLLEQKQYMDPYTQHPFVFDRQQNTLKFQCLESNEDCVIKLSDQFRDQ